MVLVHDRGRGHQMTFDKTKLLGPIVDPKLTMHTAVRKVIGQARGKVTALLRTIHLYNVKTLVNQCKCHALRILEGITPGVYHANATCLAPLQRVQTSFLHSIGPLPSPLPRLW